MATIDWAAVVVYCVFALGVGVWYARRAGRNVDEFFLSGRSLPWWITGTSMIATSFASDTPLVVSGWVRDFGIWKNWLWWCYAVSGMFMVFLFARYWRAGRIMTKAELVELRYSGKGASGLRAALGFLHAAVINPLILSWVLLAAAKIVGGLFDVGKLPALSVACGLAMTYSLMAGFWGVVVTDLVQFVIAIIGAVALAFYAWQAVGGADAVHAAVDSGEIGRDVVRIVPEFGVDGMSAAFAAFLVYMGVSWWAVKNSDGGAIAVQRIAASKDERHGMLASLWFHIGHYALRPWAWIAVGLASLLVLPNIEARAPVAGIVTSVDDGTVTVRAEDGTSHVATTNKQPLDDWKPIAKVKKDDTVTSGQIVARTDSESAYVAMMLRYLPAGLLGLVVASLLAAFMSTVDTHVNLASCYFVNDLYRRFLVRDAGDRHYVWIARAVSLVVLFVGALVAWFSESISDLFMFFIRFLSGVGPVYVMRWFWWRVRASTEITAMSVSALTAIGMQLFGDRIDWSLGPLSPGGVITAEGQLCVVAFISLFASIAAVFMVRKPDPRTLVAFFKRVRPIGWWGPVAELAQADEGGGGTVLQRQGVAMVCFGSFAGLALVWGGMLFIGYWLLGDTTATVVSGVICVVGGFGTRWALKRLVPKHG